MMFMEENCYRIPQTVLDVTHLQSGIYFVKIITDNEEVTMKFIKD
jgi:hypothetical protein